MDQQAQVRLHETILWRAIRARNEEISWISSLCNAIEVSEVRI
jgi:hypothetical protein